MTKKRDPKLRSRNPLTRTEAATLVECLAESVGYDGQDIARLLLLCHGFAYELDDTARENMLIDIEEKIATCIPGFDEFAEGAKRRQLDLLRKNLTRKGEAR